MKPLMYGYLRAPDDVPDDELDRTVEEMRRFAETEGYCYATTFFEQCLKPVDEREGRTFPVIE